jgi:uncharacterized protein (TIGR02646 family)
MVYIQKANQEPPILIEFKAQENEDWKPSFGKLSDDKVNNRLYRTNFESFLKEEQGNICCYCNDDFNTLISTGALHSDNIIKYEVLIEHFLPQSRFIQFELDYYNLFASCKICKTDSKKEYKEIHCGDAKDKNLIPNYLLDPHCEDYFEYKSNGEILPKGCSLKTFEDCEKNLDKLSTKQSMVYHTIACLNLNTKSLKSRRNRFFNEYASLITLKGKEELLEELSKYKNNEKYNLRFKGLAIFLLNQRLAKLA